LQTWKGVGIFSCLWLFLSQSLDQLNLIAFQE